MYILLLFIMHEKMSLSAGSPFSNMFKFENIEAACDDKYTVREWREGEITSHRNMTTTIIIFFFFAEHRVIEIMINGMVGQTEDFRYSISNYVYHSPYPISIIIFVFFR